LIRLADEHGIIARVERIGLWHRHRQTELPITGMRDNSDAVALENCSPNKMACCLPA